jgi:hypothetical protein
VREQGGDGEATGTLDVHEVAVRRLHQTLKLMLLLFELGVRVKEVNGHFSKNRLKNFGKQNECERIDERVNGQCM